MIVREAEKKDANIIRSLWIETLKNGKLFNKNIDLKSEISDFKRNFKKLFRENKYFLAEGDGKAAGFIGGKVKTGNGFFKNVRIGKINVLFVEKEQRKKGVGAELIKTFEAWLKTKKAEFAELNVSAKNSAAIKLYKNIVFNDFITTKRKKI